MSAEVVEFRRPQKAQRSRMETIILDEATISGWKRPAIIQRPIRITQKVVDACEKIKRTEEISGEIALGVIPEGRPHAGLYLIDGQHRLEAFKMSGLTEVLANVVFVEVADFAEMGIEFNERNSHLVGMRPDDNLRSLGPSIEGLRHIRRTCPFVGYDQLRRGDKSPIVGMSMLLRSWAGAGGDTPTATTTPAKVLAQELSMETAESICEFLLVAYEAWGPEKEYARLWSGLNLTMCMWLWRKLVLDKERGLKRHVVLKKDTFKKCLMLLSANGDYLDWLVGRHMAERDRAPCYNRLKVLFIKRLKEELGGNPKMPGPAWDGGRYAPRSMTAS